MVVLDSLATVEFFSFSFFSLSYGLKMHTSQAYEINASSHFYFILVTVLVLFYQYLIV